MEVLNNWGELPTARTSFDQRTPESIQTCDIKCYRQAHTKFVTNQI
jgi:hypothetical protein